MRTKIKTDFLSQGKDVVQHRHHRYVGRVLQEKQYFIDITV